MPVPLYIYIVLKHTHSRTHAWMHEYTHAHTDTHARTGCRDTSKTHSSGLFIRVGFGWALFFNPGNPFSESIPFSIERQKPIWGRQKPRPCNDHCRPGGRCRELSSSLVGDFSWFVADRRAGSLSFWGPKRRRATLPPSAMNFMNSPNNETLPLIRLADALGLGVLNPRGLKGSGCSRVKDSSRACSLTPTLLTNVEKGKTPPRRSRMTVPPNVVSETRRPRIGQGNWLETHMATD